MQVFLPPTLHEALAASPPAPSLRRLLRGPGVVAGSLALVAGGLAGAPRLGVAVGGPGGLPGWVIEGLAAATALAAGWLVLAAAALPLRRLVHGLRRRHRARTPGGDAWTDAKRALQWRDGGGRLTTRTHVGRYEHRLAAALAEAGFVLAGAPAAHRATIVPQFELCDLGRGARNYVADFAYLDPVQGVYIDIELDEPEHHSPARDRNRNLCFVRRGWLVIRFDEDEVVHDPAGCARALWRLVRAYEEDDLEALRQLDGSAGLVGP
ncbi:MAG: DUF559 domain-containing protein [Candidatus Sericytochromatia bacterium]|nr:DUF559 domain-containing protein [Candidatus Sericytochromatia bacterium]